MSLTEQLKKENAKIEQLKDQGPEYEAEIKRKKQLTKNLPKDLQDTIRERKECEKKEKIWPMKMKKTLDLKQVFRKRAIKKVLEEALNRTKSLDDLKEQESEL